MPDNIVVLYGIVIGTITLVLTGLAIFISINFIGLNNNIDEKIKSEVQKAVHYQTQISPVELFISIEFSRLIGNYDSEIWAVNHLLEKIYRDQIYIVFSLIKKEKQAYDDGIRLNMIEYIKSIFEKRLIENSFTNERAVEGTLWVLYHFDKLDKEGEYLLGTFVGKMRKRYDVVEKQLKEYYILDSSFPAK